jgi:flagellar protein FliS
MADRLYRTYNALIMACLRSYGRPQARDNFRRIIASLVELRDAWKFVEATAGKAAKARALDRTLESAAGR